MTALAALCFALAAFWLAWVFRTLRNLAAHQRATLAGVRA
jgi:hypothetical protein